MDYEDYETVEKAAPFYWPDTPDNYGGFKLGDKVEHKNDLFRERMNGLVGKVTGFKEPNLVRVTYTDSKTGVFTSLCHYYGSIRKVPAVFQVYLQVTLDVEAENRIGAAHLAARRFRRMLRNVVDGAKVQLHQEDGKANRAVVLENGHKTYQMNLDASR